MDTVEDEQSERRDAGGPIFWLTLGLAIMVVTIVGLALEPSAGILVIAAIVMCLTTAWVVWMIGRLIGDEENASHPDE
ncbi:MAG TPA: hypothetical protein VMA83_08025 [Solirubrobacteraceae bacterium]|nr:hypothetical protein [Solirubrobacteraceae bacterium]